MSHVPCKECRRRTVNCHSECKEYKEFLQENEKIKEARKEDGINRSTIFRANHY